MVVLCVVKLSGFVLCVHVGACVGMCFDLLIVTGIGLSVVVL